MGVFRKNGYWWIDFYDENEHRKRKKIGTAKRVALDTLEEVKTKVRQKKLGILQKEAAKEISPEAFFFKECKRYFKTNHTKRTTIRYLSVLNHFFIFLRQYPKVKFLAQIQSLHIEKYKSYRKEVPFPKGFSYFREPPDEIKKILENAKKNGDRVAKDSTINFELTTLKTVFNLAITWDYLIDNPMKGVKNLAVRDAKKPHFLTKKEITSLLDNSPDEIKLVFQTFLLTGMRNGELLNLEWEDIDFKNRVIQIRNKKFWQPKRRHERSIPIHKELQPLLKKHKKASEKQGNFVFCNGDGNKYGENKLRRALCRITKICGFPDVTEIHSLRHTYGSQLAQAGVDLPTIMEVMGHREIETTMIYLHRDPGHTTKSVNKLKFF